MSFGKKDQWQNEKGTRNEFCLGTCEADTPEVNLATAGKACLQSI